jgi:hypothetical protein
MVSNMSQYLNAEMLDRPCLSSMQILSYSCGAVKSFDCVLPSLRAAIRRTGACYVSYFTSTYLRNCLNLFGEHVLLALGFQKQAASPDFLLRTPTDPSPSKLISHSICGVRALRFVCYALPCFVMLFVCSSVCHMPTHIKCHWFVAIGGTDHLTYLGSSQAFVSAFASSSLKHVATGH